MQAIRWAQELEMPLQVNTLASAETAGDVPAIYELLKPFAVTRWSLFFLISVGRGKVLQPLSPEDGEKLMAWIYDTSKIAPFTVATTEAPSYRRVALEQMRRRLHRRPDQAHQPVPRLRNPRRTWHHVHLQYRRHLSRGILTFGDRQCPE
jgi:MoaA/NifB/PqqE/SkfB family radical SAM enzyme